MKRDMIDLRDVIARVEGLEEEIEQIEDADDFEPLLAKQQNAEAYDELATLTVLLDECKGLGGDEEWRGDWYPVTLIKDSYFRTYAEEFADDIGAVPANVAEMWPLTCIDWEQAAEELQMDYSAVTFNGETYWTR